ncbi:CDP-glycerol glycerophosphotransferase family protein [Methanobrevibacter sp.]|uniref:bifunctional glycosyltransferase/CDP-glycerol:glycerophosphate glycerophosphotransferase n=1 Tax=Methanobrevibacter sp. TaxID=66852 RepID=UPI003866A74E
MKTRVSVIIPVYNVHEFLEECIDSVLAQTINDMELSDGYERNLQIILVDDGSTDSSPEIAKRYAEDYENVEYVHEENQGLGHARNYGCKFAVGDYIIFLDSDDIVPPNAYEWMYTAAVKNDSDMTIGNVWRFKSEGALMSNIHQVAFNGTKDVTHITQSPELFYDTTAWNKLIRRSFWDEHGFTFPEGILYEDIPVTMPMHFLANNVSLVHENCYLWRIREGISKSITQTTSETKNLADRLFVMRQVDRFYDENVNDAKLHHVKNMKWLKNDLLIFVNKLRSVNEKDSRELMKGMQDYISESINPDDFEYLNEFDKLKYEYLMKDDFKSLVDLLNFQHEKLKVTKVYKKNSHVMFDADEKLFKRSPFYIDQFVRESNNFKYIQSADFCDDRIEVRGFCVIPGLDIRNFSDRLYSFYLVNSKSRKRIPLKHEDVETGDLTSYDIRFGRRFSYNASGYKVIIPYSEISKSPDFEGENRIMVSFTQEDINYNFFAGSARFDIRQKTEMQANIYNDSYFRFKYTPKNEIIIEVLPVENRYDDISIEESDICISSQNGSDDLFVYYEADSINGEVKIPFDYDEKGECYKMDISKLKSLNGKIINSADEPVLYKSKEALSFHSPEGQCILDATKDYYINVAKYENTTEICEIKRKGSVFEFIAKLYPSKDLGKPNSASLYFKNNINQSYYLISEGKFDGDNIKFRMDLSRKAITGDLNEGVHDLYVKYEFDEETLYTSLHLLDDFEEIYSQRFYDYRVSSEQFGRFQVQVFKKWAIYENTPGKRLKHSKISYKAFMKLPIIKKRIVFESMWGDKYSCNPRYLYEYIDSNHPDWQCIWSLTDEHTPINGNGIRVRRFSLKYFYYLATSKYFVNNVNFYDHYIKRPGQVEIQTMHGTPLKTLGLDVTADFPTKKSEDDFIKKCSRWDYLTVQSDFVSNLTKSCFKFKKEFLKFGYPRTDVLYTKNNPEDIKKLKEKMGLPEDKKVILYAPTWRLRDKFELKLDLDSFKKALSDEYVLVLRLHHLSAEGWKQPPKDDFIYDLTDYDSIEEMYLVSDILITDYSSVMFDYSILDRPIFLYTYDMEEYRDKLRGIYFDIEELSPGPILYTSKELEDAILNIDKTESETKDLRKRFRDEFVPFECENSSERIFDRVMKGEKESIIGKILGRILP